MKAIFLRAVAIFTCVIGVLVVNIGSLNIITHSTENRDISDIVWIGVIAIILGIGGSALRCWALIPMVGIYALIGVSLIVFSPWKVPFPFFLINCYFGVIMISPIYVFFLWRRDKYR